MLETKLGDAALLVLAAVARGCRFGFDVMDETGLKSGSVYRALSRLEMLRLVESSWEDADEALREKRPRRRYYRLTDRGRKELSSARARILVFAKKLAHEKR
jgi:DNA-binding PadR family transcriptional regulator